MNTVSFPFQGSFPTADDILAGQDLSTKTYLVTGGGSGLGLAATHALLRAGARVIVGARSVETARAALGPHQSLEVWPLDLLSEASLDALARRAAHQRVRFDGVLVNAGIMACPESRTDRGWELQFAVNHLGHFALIGKLEAQLGAQGCRVAVVSSGAHRITGIRWDDPWFRRGYDKWQAYGQSKAANVLFAVHLDRWGSGLGVRAVAAEPGSIRTPLQRHLSDQEMREAGWIDASGAVIDPTFRSPEQGAATLVWALTSPLLESHGGAYCADLSLAAAAPHACDPAEAERLWDFSNDLWGRTFFLRKL